MTLKSVTFAYKNHRGIEEYRAITPIALEYVPKPGYNYKPGWFLRGYCHDRKAERSFALENMIMDGTYFRISLEEIMRPSRYSHGFDRRNLEGK